MRERKARILTTGAAAMSVVGLIVELVDGAGPVPVGFTIAMTVVWGGLTGHWWRSYLRSR